MLLLILLLIIKITQKKREKKRHKKKKIDDDGEEEKRTEQYQKNSVHYEQISKQLQSESKIKDERKISVEKDRYSTVTTCNIRHFLQVFFLSFLDRFTELDILYCKVKMRNKIILLNSCLIQDVEIISRAHMKYRISADFSCNRLEGFDRHHD
jgi:hypothetical protein